MGESKHVPAPSTPVELWVLNSGRGLMFRTVAGVSLAFHVRLTRAPCFGRCVSVSVESGAEVHVAMRHGNA